LALKEPLLNATTTTILRLNLLTNEDGETTALCALSSQQFIVVWKATTKQWLTPADKIPAQT